jgi:hypothetical protein
MAVTNKDFKVKYGLIVEGASATVNGNQVLTETASDTYILNLIGGETLVKSVSNEFDVSAGGELSLDRTTVDAYYDAAGSAAAAETAANSYTDGRETAITTAYQSYADTAEADAKSYADGLASNYDSAGSAAAAQTAAEDYADGLASNYDSAGSAAAAQTAAEEYADAAVAAIVDGAPELLDTLNELAAALDDNPDVISNLQDLAAGKQDELTAGANIDITGATISVTGLDTADVAEDASNLYFTNQRALDATASAYDATGTAQGIVDALDTDDIEEGATNQYFTDARAKTSAAQLLTGATLDNITITGDENGLTITAENGVADSDTDDLVEGETNLYFTEQRAIDAIQDTTPNFTSVEINSLAKQVAATTSVATASQVTAYEFLGTEYRSAKFLVKTAQGSHTDVAEVLLTMDSSNNISITEYAMVGTNGSLMTITADYVEVGTTVRLRVTTANNTSVVTVVGTLLA